ncbi:hypothetical protein H6P81_004092 [Aristolochia fimbriata]|uniref:Uncharacterized protein n=1 Tax=Aristolochia fimbriata TaxID=158543 RepID=A0AAV7FEX3_ARIFI|nr:hypothetical protein H6P81_004092 [Aristolochia fimbriata]
MAPESSSSPPGKRSRDPEDEVYLDNLHSHKRYLSEIMASSLNGLTVGDSISDNLMESPARSEGMCYSRDEVSIPYSPMSEDSDDSRYSDIPVNTCSLQTENSGSQTSPVSPHRHQRSLMGLYSPGASASSSLPGCSLSAITCSHSRQRGSESEGRFPSSPSDICHSADLRRAALLRSVQMRGHPHNAPAFELPFCSGQEQEPPHNTDETLDEKSLVDQREYPLGISEEHSQEKFGGLAGLGMRRDENREELFGGSGLGRTSIFAGTRSLLRGNAPND